jgi:CheY-like chemotaxis protein
MASRLTGLVVEDEALLRLELAEELMATGWRVLEAATGEEALKLLDRLQTERGHVDFLVTDIRLGGPVDGWDVAEACRKLWPKIPVVYVSANPIVERRRVEDSVFLSKPVEVEHLIATCRRLMENRA